VQLGAIPTALDFYEPEVRRRVGALELAGAMLADRDLLAGRQLVVTSTLRLRSGIRVNVEGRRAGVSPGTWWFLLRRRGGVWRVGYDSLTGDRLAAWTTQVHQDTIRPGASTTSSAAVRAGKAAAAAFRAAAGAPAE
jgi:hypothetical protein